MEQLVLVLDLVGTFVFALSGAAAGVKRRLDLFGVLVLSFAAASTGGITRDLLIGAVPPAALTDWRYLARQVDLGRQEFVQFSANAKRGLGADVRFGSEIDHYLRQVSALSGGRSAATTNEKACQHSAGARRQRCACTRSLHGGN